MPKSFLDFFNINKTSLTELSSMSNEELIILELNNYQINQLKNALEFSRQLTLKGFNILSLEKDFVTYICENHMKIKDVDN
jgi:hypothetical protein